MEQLDFVAAETFKGPRSGFTFRKGTEGQGYYREGPKEGEQEAAGGEAAEEEKDEVEMVEPATPESPTKASPKKSAASLSRRGPEMSPTISTQLELGRETKNQVLTQIFLTREILPRLKVKLGELFAVDTAYAKIKEAKKAAPKIRLTLYEDWGILCFAHLATAMKSVCLLNILVTVMVNVKTRPAARGSQKKDKVSPSLHTMLLPPASFRFYASPANQSSRDLPHESNWRRDVNNSVRLHKSC